MKILLSLILMTTYILAYVGEFTLVKGEVTIKRENRALPAKKGDKIENKDSILTKNGMAQIRFKDDTIITIGKNSNFSVENYLFDTNKRKVDARFNLHKGLIKTLTGKIGKIAPKRFKVITKNASIGIRGTYFIVETGEDFVKVETLMGAIEFKVANRVIVLRAGERLEYNSKSHRIQQSYTPISKEHIDRELETMENIEKSPYPKNENSNHLYLEFIKGLLKK